MRPVAPSTASQKRMLNTSPNAKPRNSGVALRYELLPPNLVMRALQLQPTKIENHNCSIAHVAEIRKPMGWSGNQLKRARASSSAPS